MVTSPSARFLVAVVGAHSLAGGSSQCWQPTGDEGPGDVGELARLDVEHPAPLYARRGGVGVLAGGGTGLAADAAAAQVDHHGVARVIGHLRCA